MLSLSACSGKSPAHTKAARPDGGGTANFQPVSPAVYVAKVKNLLVGLPPTDDEVKSVSSDPTRLASLVDGWMALPEYGRKMQRFFELSFQQTQISVNDLADQAYPRQIAINAATKQRLTQNVEESFARTAMALEAEGRPFTETVTTHRFMMTPALMEMYAFLDVWQVGADGKVTDRFHQEDGKRTITVQAATGPVPLAETLDPASPNYMHWYDPDVGLGRDGCIEDPIVYPARADTLHFLLHGSLVGRKNAAGVACPQYAGSASAPQLTDADFDTWKMVTIRAPKSGETRTPFYDLATLRSTDELVLTTPRVGFFTTPAFFANWQTNQSNQMRVTINQALIVALGAAVDGSDPTVPSSMPGLDAAHASSRDCVACHRTLDPTRSILAATYSWNYHDQDSPDFSAQKGLFAFQGVEAKVANVDALATQLTAHPRFGAAWVQKLCYYANSAPCTATDPEFTRVVKGFASGWSWSALVRDFFSSPLVTYATETRTAANNGEVVAVTRRDHLCAALDARFALDDVCGLSAAPAKTAIAKIVPGLPSDGYGRGAVAPVLPNSPTLFYRAGLENICGAVAARVIDAQPAVLAGKQWSGKDPDTAIADFVALVMGLTSSDARAAAARDILTRHFESAKSKGANATNALRSTFVTACLAPSAAGVGM